MNAAVRKWLPALAPALVFVLLAVQVLYGLRGFEHPRAGLMGALEVPGRLLGWGGVALLLPLVFWLLMGWLGLDVTSMALKTLGALGLGLSVGGLASVWGAPAQGGAIGGPLGTMLSDALGSVVASALLVLIFVPSLLLASARFRLGALPGAAGASPAKPGGKPQNAPSLRAPTRAPSAGAASTARGWYPERRYDPDGNELPMEFATTDVGAIRYRDEEGSTTPIPIPRPPAPQGAPALKPAASAPSPASSPAAPPSPAPSGDWPKGLVSAPEDASEAPPAATPRPAPRPAPAVTPEAPKRPFTRQLFPKNPGDPVLLPGVRFRDEAEPPAPAPAQPKARPPEDAAPEEAAPDHGALGPPIRPFVRTKPLPDEVATVSRALEPLGDPTGMERYRKKLEASGIFNTSEPAASAPASAPAPQPAAPAKPPPPPEPPAPAAPDSKAVAKAKRPPRTKEKGPESAREKDAAPPKVEKRGRASAVSDAGSLFGDGLEAEGPAAPDPKAAPAAPARPQGAWVKELGDAEFLQAVEAALERGSASPVLLTRRMGLAYTRAQSLVERLAKTGVLGDVAANGTRPVLIRAEDLAAARSPR